MSHEDVSLREKMVGSQIAGRGVADSKVLRAMRMVPRHAFVPEDLANLAYEDEPLPIGNGQTISQPYIVAYMTEALNLNETDRVLEVGTGSGYQTAVLAEIGAAVFTVELIASLSQHAQEVLRALGYANIQFKIGDGTKGWPEFAPYDAIIVTAAPAAIPQELRDQLKVGGRMIIPVGESHQALVLVRRDADSFRESVLLSVRFVPLIVKP